MKSKTVLEIVFENLADCLPKNVVLVLDERSPAMKERYVLLCDEALSDLPKGDCYKTIYAITKIKRLIVGVNSEK